MTEAETPVGSVSQKGRVDAMGNAATPRVGGSFVFGHDGLSVRGHRSPIRKDVSPLRGFGFLGLAVLGLAPQAIGWRCVAAEGRGIHVGALAARNG